MVDTGKGNTVDFEKFWSYYRGVGNKKYMRYRNEFERNFRKIMDRNGHPQGYYNNTINLVERDLIKICSRVRIEMVSNGVSTTAIKSISDNFKKWFQTYYVA